MAKEKCLAHQLCKGQKKGRKNLINKRFLLSLSHYRSTTCFSGFLLGRFSDILNCSGLLSSKSSYFTASSKCRSCPPACLHSSGGRSDVRQKGVGRKQRGEKSSEEISFFPLDRRTTEEQTLVLQKGEGGVHTVYRRRKRSRKVDNGARRGRDRRHRWQIETPE